MLYIGTLEVGSWKKGNQTPCTGGTMSAEEQSEEIKGAKVVGACVGRHKGASGRVVPRQFPLGNYATKLKQIYNKIAIKSNTVGS